MKPKQEATSSLTWRGSSAAWPLSCLCKATTLLKHNVYVALDTVTSSHREKKDGENIQAGSILHSAATSEIVKCQISKHFQDFRGHFDWSQLTLSVTWILSPDGKHNLFKLPQRDLARQWVHSTRVHTHTHTHYIYIYFIHIYTHVKTNDYNDKSDVFMPNNVKICRSHQRRK